MSRRLASLPQLADGPITLTDGGLETVLIFRQGIELPLFAAFPLLDRADGRRRLLDYYRQAARTAATAGARFSVDTATWRANPDWAARLGYRGDDFERITRAAIALALEVRDELGTAGHPITICGVIGPRGDGYRADERQTVDEAREYHAVQLRIFAHSIVDYAAALTINAPDEAAGIVLAAREVAMPVVISFTVETDGRLASGDRLEDAVEQVDAATDGYAAYFGINCAHPSHLPDLSAPWASRVRAFRANASALSHAQLDEAEELDDGDPEQLGREFAELLERAPQLRVLGGCCGTDDRHLRAIGAACASP